MIQSLQYKKIPDRKSFLIDLCDSNVFQLPKEMINNDKLYNIGGLVLDFSDMYRVYSSFKKSKQESLSVRWWLDQGASLELVCAIFLSYVLQKKSIVFDEMIQEYRKNRLFEKDKIFKLYYKNLEAHNSVITESNEKEYNEKLLKWLDSEKLYRKEFGKLILKYTEKKSRLLSKDIEDAIEDFESKL